MNQLNDLQKAIRMYPRQEDLANEAGVSRQFVNQVYLGKSHPSQKLLSAMGWERVVTYRPKAQRQGDVDD